MAREDSGVAAALAAAWFGLRAEARCRCDIPVAEDHVADAVFVMVYGIRRAPRLRISATTTLAYLCGVARNELRWGRWRRARGRLLHIAS